MCTYGSKPVVPQGAHNGLVDICKHKAHSSAKTKYLHVQKYYIFFVWWLLSYTPPPHPRLCLLENRRNDPSVTCIADLNPAPQQNVPELSANLSTSKLGSVAPPRLACVGVQELIAHLFSGSQWLPLVCETCISLKADWQRVLAVVWLLWKAQSAQLSLPK